MNDEHSPGRSPRPLFLISGFALKEIEVMEKSLDGKHLVVTCTLNTTNKLIRTHALIDCGATGFAFCDKDFVQTHQLPMFKLNQPRQLEVIDGRPISSGDINHLTKIGLSIDSHYEEIPMFITKLGSYPLVLGIPWLRLHDVAIRFSSNCVTFDSDYCTQKCNRGNGKIVTVLGDNTPETRTTELETVATHTPSPQRAHQSQSKISVAAIGPAPFCRIAKKQKLEIFSLSLYEINEALKPPASREDEMEKIKTIVPSEYHEFVDIFSESVANVLPPHRSYDHKIPLQEGFQPPFGPIYSLSRNELEALKKWLDENLSKGFIRASSSPAGAPILFVKKSDGSLRLCVDYRGLNEGTIKNRYPLPLIRETLMRLQKARWFTKLDIRAAYNLLRIASGEEWKTAFRTRYGLFESLVMPFGLTNAPANFQHFINDILRPFLDIFVTAFLDDILIYSETLKEHKNHVRQVLKALSKAGLHLKPEKCEFHQKKVKYLGLIITTNGIEMDPVKVSAVREWPALVKLKDVQSFLGFSNFYRRFIKDYSKIVAPLTKLTQKINGKPIPFIWGEEQQHAFETLKNAFTTAPILRHFDPERQILVETDASDYVSAGILSQHDDQGVLHPVAFFSKKHAPAECNYEIYDKELLAIIRAFEEWRPELEGSIHPIQVLSDHRNLEYFMTTKLLNRRQARWSEFLSRFNFKITYRPGKAGGKPDALTRKSSDIPCEGDERLMEQQKSVLKPHNLDESLKLAANHNGDLTSSTIDDNATNASQKLIDLFKEAYEIDNFPKKVIDDLRKGTQHRKDITLSLCKEREDGKLEYDSKLYVPNYDLLRLYLLQTHHDSPVAGHQGKTKMFELLARTYYWPGMRRTVERYVNNCHVCKRIKSERHAPYGLLKPLSVPARPWQDISWDFITGLPDSDGFNCVLVVVDRLTKMRHLIPCTDKITATDLANLFIKNIWRLHGLPETIISDRGSVFAAEFWKQICVRLGIEPRLSTAFHPETDGQTERMNSTFEAYLRAYVNYLQNNWSSFLPVAEFVANNSISESIGVTPFFANSGQHPKVFFDLNTPTPNPDSIDATMHVTRLQEIHNMAKSNMKWAQDRYKEYADRHRIPAPSLRPGDLVWINTRNMSTSRPSKKLDWKRIGPYPVVRTVGSHAYEIELPRSIRIHPVFHVSLLEPDNNNPIPGQIQPPPEPVEIDGELEWVVEKIVDSRTFGRWKKLQYLVKWKGHHEPGWEPAQEINELEAVEKFHENHPEKPGPIPN